jgi:hypothetical protein
LKQRHILAVFVAGKLVFDPGKSRLRDAYYFYLVAKIIRPRKAEF